MLFLFGTLLIALSACSGPYHLLANKLLNNADMTTYKTYTFVPYEQQHTPNPWRINISEADYNAITNAIRWEMNQRGFTEAPDGAILIDVGLTVLRNATVNTTIYPAWGGIRYYYPGGFRRFGGWSPYWRDRAYRAYTTAKIDKEGVLVMDMIDAKRDVHLFTSAVSAVLDPTHQQLKDPVQLQQACDVLFSKFPIHPMKK